MTSQDRSLIESIGKSAFRLHGGPEDFDALLSLIGASRLVLIGEASHGTHEFYRIRAEITKRLIRVAGFRAVAVEADWPDAYRVNRFVQGVSGDSDATEALGDFERLTSRPPGAPSQGTHVSTISVLTRRNTATQRRWVSRKRAKPRWSSSCRNCSAVLPNTRSAMVVFTLMTPSLPSRTRASCAMPSVIIGRCSTTASHHGIFATGIYFRAQLARQFDAILHHDRTRAVEPLERAAEWDRSELPETYPSAL
jgi:hypothetical protein